MTLEQGKPEQSDGPTEAEEAFYRALEQDKAFDQAILEDVRGLTEAIERAEAKIKRFEDDYRRERERITPTLGEHIAYLIVVIPAALVINLLVIHMSELYGWGYSDWVNALLDSAEVTLTTAGGGAGLLNMAGKALWFLIVVVVGITLALPLRILQFLEVIIPDAHVLMGIAEGVVIAVLAFIVLRFSPLVTYFEERRKADAVYAKSADSLRRDKQKVQEWRAKRDTYVNTPRYQGLMAKQRAKEEHERQLRKLREYMDQAKQE